MRPTSVQESNWSRWGLALVLGIIWALPLIPPFWHLTYPGAPAYISDPGVGVSNSSRSQLAILGLLALGLAGWRPCRPSGWTAGVAVAVFLAWSGLSALAGTDPAESLFFILGWLAAACVWWAAPAILPRDPSSEWRVAVLHVPLILLSLLSLEPISYTPEEFRAAGPFQLPGAFATWLLMVLPLAFWDLFRGSRGLQPVAIASCTLGVAAMAMTFSRAAWLMAVAEVALLALNEAGCRRRELLGWSLFAAFGLIGIVLLRSSFQGLGLLLAVAALGAVPLLATSLSGRLSRSSLFRLLLVGLLAASFLRLINPPKAMETFAAQRLSTLSSADDSAVGRVMFWRAAWQLAVEHPLLGVGPSLFSESYPSVQKYYYYFSDSAHGALLELLSDVGLVGGFLFLAALVTMIRQAGPDPWTYPAQAPALIGLLMGALYSQVEISYHYAYLWITGAFLLAWVAVSGPAAPKRQVPLRPPFWPLVLVLPLLWLSLLQRASEDAGRYLSTLEAYQQVREVSDRIPFWPRPTLTALSAGLRAGRPPEELEPLVRRALRWATGESVAYQLAGEVALRQQRYSEALENYRQALALDPFNHPGSYAGVLVVANATHDQELSRWAIDQVFSIYDLEKGWEIAHKGHREKLALELRPLLYDVADGLRPDREPRKTEFIYRFLVKTGGEARAQYGLGIALRFQGKEKEASQYLRRAHQLDPNYPVSR